MLLGPHLRWMVWQAAHFCWLQLWNPSRLGQNGTHTLVWGKSLDFRLTLGVWDTNRLPLTLGPEPPCEPESLCDLSVVPPPASVPVAGGQWVLPASPLSRRHPGWEPPRCRLCARYEVAVGGQLSRLNTNGSSGHCLLLPPIDMEKSCSPALHHVDENFLLCSGGVEPLSSRMDPSLPSPLAVVCVQSTLKGLPF